MAESAADCRITTVPNGFLTKKQDDVLIALLSSNSIEDASKASGVSKTTIFKYLQIDSFRESYRKARAETVSHAITQIQSACSEAVQVLRDIMNDKESPAASRVSCARTIIETGIKAVELDEIESRLCALEQRNN